jgi:glycosyltransferase involved in cell wall biosynthesis
LKVAFIFDESVSFPLDHGNFAVYKAAEEFKKRGFQVYFLILTRQINLQGKIQDGIIFLYFGRLTKVFGFLSSLYVASFMLRHGIKLLYIDEWLFYRKRFRKIPLMVICKIFGIFIILVSRDMLLLYELATGEVKHGSYMYFKLKVVGKLSRMFANVVFIQGKILSEIAVRMGTKREKVVTIHRGVDTNMFNPFVREKRKEFSLGNEIVLGYFGMLQEYRMLDKIITEILSSSNKKLRSCRLLIGGKGKLSDKLRKIAEDSEGRILFLGPLKYNEIPGLISCCDILLCPLKQDSLFSSTVWNVKIFEALSLGKPIVATRTLESKYFEGSLKGIIFAEPGVKGFVASVEKIIENLEKFENEAYEQSLDFHYNIEYTMKSLVDQVYIRYSRPK